MQQPPDSTQMNSSPVLLQSDPQMTAPSMNFAQYPPQEDRLVEGDMQKMSIVTPDGSVLLPPGSTSAAVEQSGEWVGGCGSEEAGTLSKGH